MANGTSSSDSGSVVDPVVVEPLSAGGTVVAVTIGVEIDGVMVISSDSGSVIESLAAP